MSETERGADVKADESAGVNAGADAKTLFPRKARRILIVTVCIIAAVCVGYFTALFIYKASLERSYPDTLVDKSAATLATRFKTPEGWTRDTYAEGTNEARVQALPLKTFGLAAYLTDGTRNYAAELWGIAADSDAVRALDNLTAPADISAGFEGITAGSVLCGTTGSTKCRWLVGDVCRSADGKVKVILIHVSADSECYAEPAADGEGVWVELGDTIALKYATYTLD